MKRVGVLLFCAAALWAADSPAETSSLPSRGDGEAARAGAARSVERAEQPVDSSKVIPPGPQWLGAPLMPEAKTTREEPGCLVVECSRPYPQVLEWYRRALGGYRDTRYRDWKEEMYIEDQGGSKWHSIKISKSGGATTVVTIRRDNWTWILSTLFIRFVGVFVVLLSLWVGLIVAGGVVQRFVGGAEPRRRGSKGASCPEPVERMGAEARPAEPARPDQPSCAGEPVPAAAPPPEPEVAAVIAWALHLHRATAPAGEVTPDVVAVIAWALCQGSADRPAAGAPILGPWTVGGRLRSMEQRARVLARRR